jgi:hypothetical protein
MMCSIDQKYIPHMDMTCYGITGVTGIKSQPCCNLPAVRNLKGRFTRRPFALQMNHISETPFVESNTLSSATTAVGTLKFNVSVRVAIDAQDVDSVALLRCRFVIFTDVRVKVC